MNHYKLTFPASWNCRVSGAITESSNPLDLSEDMLEVALPTGILICAGWFPSEGRRGEYLVSVIRGLEDVVPPIADRRAADVLETVSQLVDRYRKPAPTRTWEPVSNASDFVAGIPGGQLSYA